MICSVTKDECENCILKPYVYDKNPHNIYNDYCMIRRMWTCDIVICPKVKAKEREEKSAT